MMIGLAVKSWPYSRGCKTRGCNKASIVGLSQWHDFGSNALGFFFSDIDVLRAGLEVHSGHGRMMAPVHSCRGSGVASREASVTKNEK